MGLLEVIALHATDAQRAEEDGADRVEPPGAVDEDGLFLEPAMVVKVHRTISTQICLMVRLWAGPRTDGGELVRFRGLIAPYLDEGVDRAVLGLLSSYAGIDLEVCNALVVDGGFAWTLHRAVDNCLDFDGAWEDLATLPCLDQVLTVGSARGVEHGFDELLEQARFNPGIARVIMAGGGLRPEHVSWLIRAGVRAFHIDSPARPGGGYKAHVNPDLVRTWRELIDEQTAAVRRPR